MVLKGGIPTALDSLALTRNAYITTKQAGSELVNITYLIHSQYRLLWTIFRILDSEHDLWSSSSI